MTRAIRAFRSQSIAGSRDDVLGAPCPRDGLPRERVVVTPGGHEWSTWCHAWPELLACSDARAQEHMGLVFVKAPMDANTFGQ
jgi:hypothetical protein